jgi:hypothetical protein
VDYLRPLFAYTRVMSRYDRPSHRVYMSFMSRKGWQVQFLETDLKNGNLGTGRCEKIELQMWSEFGLKKISARMPYKRSLGLRHTFASN